MSNNGLVIPKAGQPVPAGWSQEYRSRIAEIKDMGVLVKERAILEGLIAAHQKLGKDATEFGKAMAWNELQIGEELGKPPGRGGRPPKNLPRKVDLPDNRYVGEENL